MLRLSKTASVIAFMLLGSGLSACSEADDMAEQGSLMGAGESTGGRHTGQAEPGSAGGGAASNAFGGAGSGGEPPPDAPVGSTLPEPARIDCRKDDDGITTLTFINGCSQSLQFRGSDIEGGTVNPGSFVCVDMGNASELMSSKRFWGYTGSDPGAGRYTLAEFTFNTDFNDFDWYNISHVDAHNLPMQIHPVQRPQCATLTCEESWLDSCPKVGQYTVTGGEVTSCVSPDRDDPESEVVLFFEGCDEAYAWSLDEHYGEDISPMRACAAEDFDIVFCPEAE